MTWTYDAQYQLTREQRSGTNAYDLTYTYDAVGNRATKVDSGQTTTYSYDAANQLTVAVAPGGTRTTYSYDGNGNLVTSTAGGAVTTYTWDGENRLTVAALPDGSLATFTYDATGLRRKAEAGGTTKQFIWDLQNVLLETDGGGTTQAAYTQTPEAIGALVAQRRGSASSFYHYDMLGSTTELTDGNGAGTDSARYYAFGETKAHSGSTVNPFGYVGRLGYYSETNLELQYLRARWYQPGTARFLSTDPLGGRRGRYAYVGKGPLGTVDPSGMQGLDQGQGADDGCDDSSNYDWWLLGASPGVAQCFYYYLDDVPCSQRTPAVLTNIRNACDQQVNQLPIEATIGVVGEVSLGVVSVNAGAGFKFGPQPGIETPVDVALGYPPTRWKNEAGIEVTIGIPNPNPDAPYIGGSFMGPGAGGGFYYSPADPAHGDWSVRGCKIVLDIGMGDGGDWNAGANAPLDSIWGPIKRWLEHLSGEQPPWPPAGPPDRKYRFVQ